MAAAVYSLCQLEWLTDIAGKQAMLWATYG